MGTTTMRGGGASVDSPTCQTAGCTDCKAGAQESPHAPGERNMEPALSVVSLELTLIRVSSPP